MFVQLYLNVFSALDIGYCLLQLEKILLNLSVVLKYVEHKSLGAYFWNISWNWRILAYLRNTVLC